MLFDALPQVAVTIGYEDQEGNQNEVRSMQKDGYMGITIAGVIGQLGFPRQDQLIAEIVDNLAEMTDLNYDREFFPGQNDAIDDFISAAQRIVRGWERFDATKGY